MIARILVPPLRSCHNLSRRSKCPCQPGIVVNLLAVFPARSTQGVTLGKTWQDVFSMKCWGWYFWALSKHLFLQHPTVQVQGEDISVLGILSSYWLWAILVQCVLQSRIAYFLGNKVRISIQHCHFLCSLYESLWGVFDREDIYIFLKSIVINMYWP